MKTYAGYALTEVYIQSGKDQHGSLLIPSLNVYFKIQNSDKSGDTNDRKCPKIYAVKDPSFA